LRQIYQNSLQRTNLDSAELRKQNLENLRLSGKAGKGGKE